MKKIAIVTVLAGIARIPCVASADQITLNLAFGYLSNGSGQLLPVNSTMVLLVDADRDGFGDLTTSYNAWKADADDVILARFPLTAALDGPGTGDWAFQFDNATPGLQAGNPMMLVWYDFPYDADATGPCDILPEVSFGTYRDDIPADLGSAVAGWTIPTQGGTFSLNAFTEDAGGLTGFHGAADQVVIPEPASMLTMLVVGGLVAARRRRNRNVA